MAAYNADAQSSAGMAAAAAATAAAAAQPIPLDIPAVPTREMLAVALNSPQGILDTVVDIYMHLNGFGNTIGM